MLLPILLVAVSSASAIEKDSVFLKQIFKRYGGNEGITFEGLEHLMENLGLGGLKFEKSHNETVHRTADGDFRDIHDSLSLHTHNHTLPRQKRAFKIDEKCLSPTDLLNAYGLKAGHGVKISKDEFLPICPAMLHQLDRRLCSPRAIFNQAPDLGFKAWIYAIISVVVMSLVGLVGVVIVPVLDKAFFNSLLSLLGALAVGTLSGDALIHLLPHALQAHPGGEVVIARAGTAFLILMLFFTIEAGLHAQGKRNKEKRAEKKKEEETSYAMVIDKGHSHDHNGDNVVWMVITGDGLHNFTDGLAMGAAFRQDIITGVATALAVLTHELPHELGDFALLVQNGMSLKSAILYNLASSVLSIFGVVFGLLLANYSEAALWVYSATAGSFLYIALATLIPEMQKQVTSISQLMIQLCGMSLGGALMFLIAIYEHSFHEFLREELH